MTNDKASNLHPTYTKQQGKRDVYRAVYGGTDTVRDGTTKYLPMYPAEEEKDYSVRKDSSTIDGIVLGGVDTLCGSVFEGEVDVSGVHATIQPLLENVDNKGNSFNIFARDAFRESFDGFSCILVDMPTEKAADAEQEKQLGLRPYLNLYCAANVINWRYEINPVSKQKQLVLLVLKEVSQEPDGRFSVKPVTRYRVFEAKNGVVTWELWKETDDKTGKGQTLVLDTVLKDGKQIEAKGVIEKVKEIPAAFIGDVEADPKLLVESRLEIKAYQKESSYDIIEYLSVPTFTTKGYEGEDKLKLGASAHLKLPALADADAFYVQIDSAGLEKLAVTIEAIKNWIRSRVNYLVQSAMPKSDDKTATQVVTEDKDKQARLIVWHDELKDGLETALMFMGQFLGLGDDEAGEIVLQTKWMVAEQKAMEQEMRDITVVDEELEIKRMQAKSKAK